MTELNPLQTIGSIIREADDKIKHQMANEIGHLIMKLMDQLKVTEKLTKGEVYDAVVIITTDFKALSIEDITTAFRLIITHGYGEKTPSGEVIEYSYYNRFGLEYICRFLRVYQWWKAKQKMEQPALIAEQKSLPISETANRKTRRKIAELTYRDLCIHDRFLLINVDGVFDEMQAAGLTDDWEQLKNMYISQVQKVKQPNKETMDDKNARKVGLIGRLILDLPILNVPEDDLKQAKKLYIRERFLFWKEQKRERIFENK